MNSSLLHSAELNTTYVKNGMKWFQLRNVGSRWHSRPVRWQLSSIILFFLFLSADFSDFGPIFGAKSVTSVESSNMRNVHSYFLRYEVQQEHSKVICTTVSSIPLLDPSLLFLSVHSSANMPSTDPSTVGIPWVERYRPKSLNDVAHQGEVVSTLQNAVKTGRLPHLLFYGPPGSGKVNMLRR